MVTKRRAVVVVALVVAALAVLAVLAAVAALPVVMALASALLALVVALGRRGRVGRGAGGRGTAGGSGWRSRDPRPFMRRRRLARAAAPDPGGATWTTTWQTLPPPDELAKLRQRVTTLLTEWNVSGDAAQPTLMVLTELLTNAIEHADAPIRITLGLSPTVIRVQVHDATPELPQRHPYHPQRVRGHGLEIVEGLALDQGWNREPEGKTVWADVPTHWPHE